MDFVYGSRRHWNEVAGMRSPDQTPVSNEMCASVLEAVGDFAGKRALDVGTGLGKLPVELVRRGGRATGIDVSSVGLERAWQTARGELGDVLAEGRLDFREMDAARLSFEESAFDVVTCLKSIWCVPEAEPCLAELARVLVPGGKLVLQIYGRPEECPLLMLGARLLGKVSSDVHMPSGQRGPFDFTPELTRHLLTRAGFDDIRFAEFAMEAEITSFAHYWQTLRSIAGSAYYAYTLLAEEHGDEIERAWERRVAHLRGADGAVRLGLTWLLAVAERGRAPLGSNGHG